MSSLPPVELFGRRVIVQAGLPGGQGYRWEDLRIAFDVKKTLSGKKNSAEIQIYNPSPDSVNLFQSRETLIQLYVGYDVLTRLVQGTIIRDGANVERKGPTRILTLELQDGGLKLECAQLSLSYAKEVSLRDVLGDISRQSGLPIGNISGLDDTLTFPNGATFSGLAQNVLERLGTMSNADFSIQDGVINMIARDEDSGRLGLSLTSENGTLLAAAKKEEGKVEVTARLAGSIMPGDRFEVRGENVSGFFKAIDVQYTGDSGYDKDFNIKITGRPIVPVGSGGGAGSGGGRAAYKGPLQELRKELEAEGRVYDLFVDAQTEARALSNENAEYSIVRFLDDYYGVLLGRSRVSRAAQDYKGVFLYDKDGNILIP